MRPQFIAILALVAIAPLQAAPPTNPDLLTQSAAVDRTENWNLGPTGMRGWIYTRPATNLDSAQGRITAASRQILVTDVGKGTPADGVMKVDDVILGVNGKPFTADARKTFARAITEAEKTANAGRMDLTVSRDGKVANLQLHLKVMGDYSPTAPYNCPKTEKIFKEACVALEKEPLDSNHWGCITGLALLSTGDEKYLPKIKEFAHTLILKNLNLEGCSTWMWGYNTLFLAEYYLITKDEMVLPTIQAYTIQLAKSQGMYGTFGHGGSEKTEDGKLHGSVPPYGPVNAAGLIANIAIVMGKKCGVKDPEIDPAIERGSKFFGYYMDKGAIPYGEHMPWASHENNGKNAMTAIYFGLQGNRIPEAKFFAKMCTAAYQCREYGHTGQGFSFLWGALGANMGGPRATSAYMKETSWLFDLVRRSDGSFTYDGAEQYGPGQKTKDESQYFGNASYNGISPTATYVLSYSMPLKKLCITGRDLAPSSRLTADEVTQAVAAGRFDETRTSLSVPELLKALDDWSPIARSWAAEELAKRPEAKSMVRELMTMAEGNDMHVRQGACETLGYIGDPEALPVLVRLLTHQDRWLRVKAADALKKMGGKAKPVIPDMLKAVVTTATPLLPVVWDDPVQLTHGELAAALFSDLLRGSLDGVDRSLLYPAIKAVANNPDGMARATLKHTFENLLTEEDVRVLAPTLVEAVRVPSPADTMFNPEIRMGALKVLTKYHYKEAIAAGINFVRTQGGHGSESRTGEIMELVAGYGIAARSAVPQMKELIVFLNDEVKRGGFPGGELNERRTKAVEKAIAAVEAATTQPELKSISDSLPKAGKAR